MVEERLDASCSTRQVAEGAVEIVELTVESGGHVGGEWSLAGHAATFSATFTPSGGGGPAVVVVEPQRHNADDGPFPFGLHELNGAPLPAGVLRFSWEAHRCKGESWRGKVALRFWTRAVSAIAPLRDRLGLDQPRAEVAEGAREESTPYETKLTQLV